MAGIKSYEDLIVWQKSRELVKETYLLCKKLPKEETYALGDQMRRAAVSIPSNIAEGSGRTGNKDFKHFLSVALGSTYELRTQLTLCEDLGFFTAEDKDSAFKLTERIAMMLNKLMSSLSD